MVPSGNYLYIAHGHRKFVSFLIRNGGSAYLCKRLPEGSHCEGHFSEKDTVRTL